MDEKITLSTQVDQGLKDRLDAGAAKTSRSIAAILRLALIDWLDSLDETTNNR